MSAKGKEIAGKPPTGWKRKRDGGDNDKYGGRSMKERGVLKFFEDAAEVDDFEDSDDDDIDDFFLEEELDLEQKVNNEPGQSYDLPFFPKEEQLEEEIDRMMEGRYRDGSGLISYAQDNYETKRSVDESSLVPREKDPTIWKVKCMLGRERHSAFCLMQKFVDLMSLGTKLQILSAFSVEHIKGFIYIEACKLCDIVEACKGLCGIYNTRVEPVPRNEVSHLLSVRSRRTEISEGMWARVKNGKYKGDLAQVVAVNDARKRAMVKLIPRIDLQALAQKFGGGRAVKRGVISAPRLISSSELEEFRPLIQYRRDRDTGKHFEILDGLMLKDGYLYKRVSIDSLSFWGVMASEEELLKFENPENNESQDLEWLTQLYGDRKRKQIIESDKGLEKGEGSSGADAVDDSKLHSLVCFGRREFGLIIGKEKDDHYNILTEGKEGPVVVPVEQRKIKKGPSDMKFTALDQHGKAISVGDTVRVMEGPLKGRQGVVKQIYRGTIFMHDETETENGGYMCARSQMCEKVKFSFDDSKGKGDEFGNLEFEDFSSSPKSPLSPNEPWKERESNPNFNQKDKDGVFSIGQTVRIRIGHLKGYLCRVIATRRSDVTVKLDSQQKILTVKSEHLSEIRSKTSFSLSEDAGPSSFKPFDQLGTEGGSRDWMGEAGTSAGSDGWNTGGQPNGRSPWPSFPAAGLQKSLESDSGNPSGSENNDPGKEVEDTVWGKKVTQNLNSSWGTTVADDKALANENGARAWETTARVGSGCGLSDGWDKATASGGGIQGSSINALDKWNQSYPKTGNSGGGVVSWGRGAGDNDDASKMSEEPWGKGKNVAVNQTNSRDGAPASKIEHDSWSNSKHIDEAGSWVNNSSNVDEDSSNKEFSGWGQHKSWDKGKDVVKGDESSWCKPADTQKEMEQGKAADNWSSKTVSAGSWGNVAGWGQPEDKGTDETNGWKKADGAHRKQSESWSGVKISNDASDNQTHSDDKWSKPKSVVGDGGSSWSKQGEGSWGKRDGGSSWGSQAAINTRDESKKCDWTSSGVARQESGWSKKSNWNAESGGANQESDWAKKSSWNDKSDDPGQESLLGRIEGQSEASGDQPGGGRWGGGFGGRGGSGRGGFRGRGERGGFRGRGDRGGFRGRGDRGGFRGRGDRGGFRGRGRSDGGGVESSWSKQDGGPSSWGTQAAVDAGESKNCSWSPSDGANLESGWSKSSNWNSESSSVNRESNWAKNSSWNSGSGAANKESGWAKKSGSQSESGDAEQYSVLGRIEDQSEAFSDQSAGGRRDGGFRGRGGFDRGDRGYRGRDASGRGGYGGRGRSDRGGSGSDGGSFNGRGGADRGRSGGRSWERGEQSGDWNIGSDSGEAKTSEWSKGAGNNSQCWKSGDGVSWNKESGGDGWNSGPGWKQPSGSKDGTNNVPTSGWSKRNGSTSDPGGNQGCDVKGTCKSWNSGSDGADNHGGGWNSNDSECKKPVGTGGWNKGTGSVSAAGGNEGGVDIGQSKQWISGNSETSNETGGWTKQGSGLNKGKDPENSGRAEDQSKIWNQSSSVARAPAWNQSAKEGSSGDGQSADFWSKPAATTTRSSSWSGKGGW